MLSTRAELTQQEMMAETLEKLIDIEAGCEEPLVDIYDGYRVEFGSRRRSELRSCAEFRKIGREASINMGNLELVDIGINGDLRDFVYPYDSSRRGCSIGSGKGDLVNLGVENC